MQRKGANQLDSVCAANALPHIGGLRDACEWHQGLTVIQRAIDAREMAFLSFDPLEQAFHLGEIP